MKLRSLYDCRNHWQWLEITGSSEKETYEPAKKWRFNCACCDYMKHSGDGTNAKGDYICDACPLTGYAWQVDPHSNTAPCDTLNTGSYFFAWYIAETKEKRQYFAHKMVQACNQAIEKELTK